MPFDFITYKNYKLDMNKVFNELGNRAILSDKKLQSDHLNQWKKTLKEIDGVISSELNTEEAVKKLKADMAASSPEIMQVPVKYGYNTVYLHISVSIAKQITGKHRIMAENIAMDEFTAEDSIIIWEPVDENGEYEMTTEEFVKSKDPVIMIPFLDGEKSLMVIDGREELTFKAKAGVDMVPILSMNNQMATEVPIFLTTFDQMFYIMHNELEHMANATRLDEADPMLLVQKSYLINYNYNF
jgi:hypothetical protein